MILISIFFCGFKTIYILVKNRDTCSKNRKKKNNEVGKLTQQNIFHIIKPDKNDTILWRQKRLINWNVSLGKSAIVLHENADNLMKKRNAENYIKNEHHYAHW